jgi:seryl-tRNA synthetase
VTGRAMLAIMENFQDDDGSVSIPASLHEFGAPQKLGAEKARVR